jgi:hypothetical protein
MRFTSILDVGRRLIAEGKTMAVNGHPVAENNLYLRVDPRVARFAYVRWTVVHWILVLLRNIGITLRPSRNNTISVFRIGYGRWFGLLSIYAIEPLHESRIGCAAHCPVSAGDKESDYRARDIVVVRSIGLLNEFAPSRRHDTAQRSLGASLTAALIAAPSPH